MDFFDFVVGDIHGIRVRELRQHARDGGKVVATYCVFVPDEIILAAGAIPVGLCAGTSFSIPVAEQVLPRNTCDLIKSSFGFKLGRTCPYVQASHLIVGETTCDGKKKMFEILSEYQPVHVMEVPNKKNRVSRDLWLAEVTSFKGVVEKLTANQVTPDKLADAIRLMNGKRRALQRLARARRAHPSPISGKDALLVTQVSFYDDVARDTRQINALCDELEERIGGGQGVLSGQSSADPGVGVPHGHPQLEAAPPAGNLGRRRGGRGICIGTRAFSDLVAEDQTTVEDQLQAIARTLHADPLRLFHPQCRNVSRYRPARQGVQGGRSGPLQSVRFGPLLFCHTYAMEAIRVARALEKEGIPLLALETDYGEDSGQLRTRIDAFLEMIRE